MRLKPVPEPPPDLDGLATARRAVPRVPGSEDDCCARLRGRLDLASRDRARTWLTFLRALGLVEQADRGTARGTARGYVRTGADFDPDDPGDRAAVAVAFRENVYAAREVLAALAAAAGALDADAVFDEIVEVVPPWERHRDPGWRDTWRERVRRLLEWAVLLGLAERVEGGYRLAAG